MRVRNPDTGTVVELDTETANAYVSAGWEKVDAEPRRRRSTSAASTSNAADSEAKTQARRRRASSQ